MSLFELYCEFPSPGATIVGFNLPSSVGPLELKDAISFMDTSSFPSPDAPTLTIFLAVAGVPTVLEESPEFPIA